MVVLYERCYKLNMNSHLTQPAQAFKKCPSCGYSWITREEFFSDPMVKIIGYQVKFGELELGLLLFNHNVIDCGTTMAIEADDFKDLYDGPIYSKRLTDTDKCQNYCQNENNLSPCPAECECAYIREVIQIIKHWPKH